MDYHGLLNLATELGCRLMESGAEIYRVEDSVLRLMRAYGAQDAQIFAIPGSITVSFTTEQGEPITRLCRVDSHTIDLDRLELCNALCRRLCKQTPPIEQARQELAHLYRSYPRFHPLAVMLGHFLIGAFFTLFFGGSVLDALCGGVCGLAIYLANRFLVTLAGPNLFFRTLLAALVSSMTAQLLVHFAFGHQVDTITIGALMILVPGVALTTAMREVMAGDLISGVSHTAESLLTAVAIALGTGATLFLSGLFGPDALQQATQNTQTVQALQILFDWVLPCVYSFGACIGFCLLFNIHGPGMLICGGGGAVGWLVYLLMGLCCQSEFPRYLAAAVVITLYSELMSRIRRCPVTSYLIVALLPLVPGGGIYRAMRFSLSGDNQQFLATLLQTFGIAGALALGALLASSVVRLILSVIRRIRK